MRWLPWRYHAHPSDLEGKEMAKKQLSQAQAIARRARELEPAIRTIQRENHLGPKVYRALGGE